MLESTSNADPARLARLLVGYDGSDAAAAASAFALWLAGKAGAVPGCAGGGRAAAARRRHGWRHRLDELASYAAEGAAVECEVVRGSPAAALLDEARVREADLLLVGSTGVGALRARFLGSVSSQVVDHAPCPVLVFREGHPALAAHVQAIVVGVDGSASSMEAVGLARQLAPPLARGWSSSAPGRRASRSTSRPASPATSSRPRGRAVACSP